MCWEPRGKDSAGISLLGCAGGNPENMTRSVESD